MPSSFSWLDFSETERQRALEVVRQFEEHGTVDELGVGVIRDAIADRLFPGISTIQSRARYFLFIPWMYLDLERRRVPSSRVAEAARRAEIALIDALAESDDPVGTIGIMARGKLKNLPSRAYWVGLHTFGIRSFQGSQDSYHRSLDAFYRLPASNTRNDDGEAFGGRTIRNWHANLPSPPAAFPREASLTLTAEEGSYLSERIAMTQPASLMAWLTSNGSPSPEAAFPWEHRQAARFPAHNQIELEHARNFSELMLGSALLYNFMLSEKCGNEEWRSDYEQALEDWSQLLGEREAELHAWDRTAFWQLIEDANARVSLPTRIFVNGWLDLALSPDTRKIRSNATARQLIVSRELQLKRALARLTNQRPLELWRGASGAGQMDYRWLPVARATVEDIQHALGREPV
jgi:hypothetical protein